MYNPYSLTGKTILITGASSGIGKATAIECSKMGAKIIACGRNVGRLQETISMLDGTGHSSFVGDLNENSVVEDLLNVVPFLDGVVLAAGRGQTTPFLYSSKELFLDIFKNNFFSLADLCLFFEYEEYLNDKTSD